MPKSVLRSSIVSAGLRDCLPVDERGNQLWEYTLAQTSDFFTHSPVTADLDSDMKPDVLIGTGST